ncbi:MAG: uridine kinase [Patescibacteria group bacterium]
MQNQKSVLILIAGGTASGKTTCANEIIEALGPELCVRISHDWYYDPDSPWGKKGNYDHPDSFDNKMVLDHIQALKRGEAIKTPRWNYRIHARKDEWILTEPKPVIILEGILVLTYNELVDEAILKIFVDTDNDERFIRRALRDSGEERGRTLDDTARQWRETVKPMHETFCWPSRKKADIIIPNGGHNPVTNFIIEKGLRLLSERGFDVNNKKI